MGGQDAGELSPFAHALAASRRPRSPTPADEAGLGTCACGGRCNAGRLGYSLPRLPATPSRVIPLGGMVRHKTHFTPWPLALPSTPCYQTIGDVACSMDRRWPAGGYVGVHAVFERHQPRIGPGQLRCQRTPPRFQRQDIDMGKSAFGPRINHPFQCHPKMPN